MFDSLIKFPFCIHFVRAVLNDLKVTRAIREDMPCPLFTINIHRGLSNCVERLLSHLYR